MAGGALIVLGALLTLSMTRRTADAPSVPGSGFATATGLALAFWGLVAVVAGLLAVA